MQATQKFVTSKGDTVISALSDLEAAQMILAARRAGFAAQLAQATLRGRLTRNQRPWLHKIAVELAAPPAPAVQPVVSLLPLAAMLARAGESLKRPRVKVTLDGVTVQLAIAGARARFPGSLDVTDGGSFGSNQWFGRVHVDGRWEPRRADAAVLALLERWAADPVGVAREHGQKSGACCFCRLTLKTRESTAVGYGPVCAEKFGLPWGGKAATEAERRAEQAALEAQDREEVAA